MTQMNACDSDSGGRTPAINYRVAHRGAHLNITNRCTLRCGFCPRHQDNWFRDGCNLKLEREPGPDEIIAAIGDWQGYEGVVFSGLGEPTLRLYVLLEVAQELRRKGLRIHLVTDGLANLVHARDVTPDLENIIDTVSISLNAQDEFTYNVHCPSDVPGAYGAMLDFADRVRYFVSQVTLTAVADLQGVDVTACARIADGLGVDFGVREPGCLE